MSSNLTVGSAGEGFHHDECCCCCWWQGYVHGDRRRRVRKGWGDVCAVLLFLKLLNVLSDRYFVLFYFKIRTRIKMNPYLNPAVTVNMQSQTMWTHQTIFVMLWHWLLSRFHQRLRAHVLRLPPSGAARPFVQHHEGDQPAAGPTAGHALRPAGPDMVRTVHTHIHTY